MFITFEGIDFCGKSTQVELLKNYFEKKGRSVKVIREPGGTVISEKIREILLDHKNNKMFMETELLLFSASRAQLVREIIKPFLDKDYIVISDRFHDSSTAYQGYGRGIPIEAVLNVHKLAIGTTAPDLTFIIDIPVSVAAERKGEKTHQELDRIEVSSNDFFEKVRSGYLTIAKKEQRFRIIDGTKSKEEIHKIIVNNIEEFEKK